jgi:hypothetical protein
MPMGDLGRHLAHLRPIAPARTLQSARSNVAGLKQFRKVVLFMFALLRSRSSSSKTSALGWPKPGSGRAFALASFATLLFASSAAAAQPPVGLGTAGPFVVLSGSAVTNTGPSVLNGDLGVSPGSAISGFPPGIVNGAVHATDGVAGQAKNDLVTAYNDAAGRTPATTVSGDLGGRTFTAGVRKSASSMGLTGALTLDGEGDPNAVFIFQIGSALTTATDSSVRFVNGAQPCNVYWQVGSDATLGTRTAFAGTIMALTSVSLNDAATVNGRLLARNGAVTLINNTITRSQCATGSDSGSGSGSSSGTSTGTSTGAGADITGPVARIVGLPGTRQPPVTGTRNPPMTSVCTTRNFSASVRLRDGSGIRAVKVYLDGRLVRTTTLTRFTLRVTLRSLRIGRHRLTVIARDRAGNRSTTTRYFGRCAVRIAAPHFTG